MRLHLFTAFAVLASEASAESKNTIHTRLNGWFKCSDYTFFDQGGSGGAYSECATFQAPLCYPGICKTPRFTDPRVDIFVKRMEATNGDPKTATNVWLLEGGPGYSSTTMESSMVELFIELNGTANVYTMDYRGTGRSTFLDCVAAQATTTGSPGGRDFDPAEVPTCAQELENEYGDLAAFSTTSAATDLVTFISEYSNAASTILYGSSYGTVFVERVMHLNPPQVTGYVMDGIATTSGASADKFFSMSKRDSDFGMVGDRFLALCSQDATCRSHFKQPNTLPKMLQGLLSNFDRDPNSTCALLVSRVQGMDGVPPSAALSVTLGSLLMDAELRKFIPPVVYRLNRCGPKDVDILTQFVNSFNANSVASSPDDAFYSPLLFNLIVYSEIYETPQPSMVEMERRFKNALLSTGAYYSVPPLYCAFSKEKSKTCSEYDYGNYAAHGIIYDHDEYWNKTATIPSQASVLLLSSKLDAQTPHEYAEYLLETLDGDKKEMVTFNSSIHGVIAYTPLERGGICGVKIIASYVRSKGDLKGLDKSCVAEMPEFDLTVSADYQNSFFSTDDVYDGVINSSLA